MMANLPFREEVECTTRALFSLIYDSERAVRMSAEAKKLGITDATEKIYSLMENLVKASR